MSIVLNFHKTSSIEQIMKKRFKFIDIGMLIGTAISNLINLMQFALSSTTLV